MADENQITDAMGELKIEEDDPESVEPPPPACENNPEDGESSAKPQNNFLREYGEHFLQQPIAYATSAALQELENNPTGPLTAVQLRDFLQYRLHQNRRTLRILNQYTGNARGALNQFKQFEIRIKEIKMEQDEIMRALLRRINALIEASGKSKKNQWNAIALPAYVGITEAFRYMSSRGPLNEEELRNFINTGKLPSRISDAQQKELKDQLYKLKFRILNNDDVEQHNLKFTLDKIKKAIQGLEKEIEDSDQDLHK